MWKSTIISFELVDWHVHVQNMVTNDQQNTCMPYIEDFCKKYRTIIARICHQWCSVCLDYFKKCTKIES